MNEQGIVFNRTANTQKQQQQNTFNQQDKRFNLVGNHVDFMTTKASDELQHQYRYAIPSFLDPIALEFFGKGIH